MNFLSSFKSIVSIDPVVNEQAILAVTQSRLEHSYPRVCNANLSRLSA
jgi:hypothetical protein